MTVAECGDYLGITERQVRRLLSRRDLSKVKVGKLVRVHIEDADAYIDSQRVPAGE
jgi:excisionase family DNA binding protein